MTDYKQQFINLPPQLDWLQQLRQENFTRFETAGFPQWRQEAWKYTNVKAITKNNFNHATQITHQFTDAELAQLIITNLDCHRLIFVNGIYVESLATVNTDLNNCSSLATAINNNSSLVKQYLNQHAQHIDHGFAALNSAFIYDGAFIQITKNQQINKPIHLIYVNTENNNVNHPRNLIILEEQAQCQLIESYISLNCTQTFTNVISEIILNTGAQLEHIKIQQENKQAFHIATTQVQQMPHSHYISHQYNFGAALARSDINTYLAEGAYCTLNGLYLAANKQHVDHHTCIAHEKPHTTSRQFYKGIISDSAHAVFNGQVYVHPGAKRTDAHQSNKNLLLSDKAEIDTKPQFEIYNDDVKCAHGATVGQLSEAELFYLRSRGLEETMAKTILMYAFASELIQLINTVELKKYLQQLLLQFLPQSLNLQELVQ